MLAAWIGILGGFLLSVATGIRFLVTRRGGKHALAGFALVVGIPALFAGSSIALAKWQLDQREREQAEYLKSKGEHK